MIAANSKWVQNTFFCPEMKHMLIKHILKTYTVKQSFTILRMPLKMSENCSWAPLTATTVVVQWSMDRLRKPRLCPSQTGTPDCSTSELRLCEMMVVALTWHCLGIVVAWSPRQSQDSTTSIKVWRIAPITPRQCYDRTTTVPRSYHDRGTTICDDATIIGDWPRLTTTSQDLSRLLH